MRTLLVKNPCLEWTSGTRVHVPGTMNQGPGTMDQGPGTRDQGPRTKDQGPNLALPCTKGTNILRKSLKVKVTKLNQSVFRFNFSDCIARALFGFVKNQLCSCKF